MSKKEKPTESGQAKLGEGCCQVVSLVTVDERGQMILPKEIREKAKIVPGEKFALVTWEKAGEVCCLTLIKAGALGGMVQGFLGTVMANLTKK